MALAPIFPREKEDGPSRGRPAIWENAYSPRGVRLASQFNPLRPSLPQKRRDTDYFSEPFDFLVTRPYTTSAMMATAAVTAKMTTDFTMSPDTSPAAA